MMGDRIKRVILLSLLLGALACAGFAQSDEPNRTQNLSNCLDGFGTCDHSLLTPTQAKQIADLQHDRNHSRRLTGFGECDDSALPLSEAKQVADTKVRRNLLACETTSVFCDKLLLKP